MPKPDKQWPATVQLRIDLCPRCGEDHGETQYRRFELGDPQFTHWAYCQATGEPLLLNMARPHQKQPDKFFVRFMSAGRQATCAPDPRYPNGVDLQIPKEDNRARCKLQLQYPAPGVGVWKAECTECGARFSCTAAGRVDDPRSAEVPCRR